MMDGDTGAPGPHDAMYYIKLAKSIDDDVSYANTAVFNEDMSMDTFVAVVFKRKCVDLRVHFSKIPAVVKKLEAEGVRITALAGLRETTVRKYGFIGPVTDGLLDFIDARE
jgi:hypothetical protein